MKKPKKPRNLDPDMGLPFKILHEYKDSILQDDPDFQLRNLIIDEALDVLFKHFKVLDMIPKMERIMRRYE